MRAVAIAAVTLAIAVSPAFAKKDKPPSDDAVQNAQERVDELEAQLLDENLSDKRRENIEEAIEKLETKFNLPVDPPEPVVLFQDDFNRGANTDTLGGTWQETEPNLEGGHNFIRIQDGFAWIGANSTATNSVTLNPNVDYDKMTLAYTFGSGTARQEGSTLTVSWSGDGVTYTPITTYQLADYKETIQQFSHEVALDGTDPALFAWKFETSGTFGELVIDDFVVTGNPSAPVSGFVGF